MRETRPAPLHDIVGLIPAAGQATRIAPLPCSKELYPVGLRSEMHVGEVIQAAIEAGLHVNTLQFRHGWYLDIGTPEGLASLHRARES